MHTVHRNVMVLPLALLLLLGGCAAGHRAELQQETPPVDFSLDVTILSAVPSAAETPIPSHLRQSRYVLFPDGRLHYGADAQRGADWLPPPVRMLDSQRMRELWLLAVDAGLAHPESGEPPVNFKTIEPAPGQVLHLLAMTGRGQRWAVIRPVDEKRTGAATSRIIEHLAELAFASGDDQRLGPLPQRYDFGPDPYERYR